MATAPACFIPVSAPTAQPQSIGVQALAPLTSTDIPSMQAAVNGLITNSNQSVSSPGQASGSPFGSPGSDPQGGGGSNSLDKKDKEEKKKEPKWEEDHKKRKTSTHKIVNPNDENMFVEFERIDSFTMKKELPEEPQPSKEKGTKGKRQQPAKQKKKFETITWTR